MSILKRTPKRLCEWTGKVEWRTGDPEECNNKATRKHKTWMLCEKHHEIALKTDRKSAKLVKKIAERIKRGDTVL